jgi:hypothetical protein
MVSNPINKKVINMKDDRKPHVPPPEEQALVEAEAQQIIEELKCDPQALDHLEPAVTIVVENPKNFEGFTFGEVEFAEDNSSEIETAQILNLDGSEWNFDGKECTAHFDSEDEAERVSKLLDAYDIEHAMEFKHNKK